MSSDVKRISLRLSVDLHEQVKKAAVEDMRSLHSWLILAIQRAAREAVGGQRVKVN